LTELFLRSGYVDKMLDVFETVLNGVEMVNEKEFISKGWEKVKKKPNL